MTLFVCYYTHICLHGFQPLNHLWRKGAHIYAYVESLRRSSCSSAFLNIFIIVQLHEMFLSLSLCNRSVKNKQTITIIIPIIIVKQRLSEKKEQERDRAAPTVTTKTESRQTD